MRLTNCQKEVLLEVLKGKSNKEIAKTLNRKEATVKLHVYALFNKFNTDSRLKLVCGIYSQFVNPEAALSAGEFKLKSDFEKLETLVERINENG